MQTLGKPPGGIYFIKALATGNLDKIVFKNQPSEDQDEKFHADETTDFVACDIQLMQSQGMRSEIVEISAQHIRDREKSFWSKCYGHHEEDFLDLPNFTSIDKCLKQFFEVMFTSSQKNLSWIGCLTKFFQLK